GVAGRYPFIERSLPKDLARVLVERGDRSIGRERGANDAFSIHQRMVRETPDRPPRSEVLRVASLPHLLPVSDSQAQEFAVGRECVKPVAIHCGRALREPAHERVFLDGIVHARGPEFLSRPSVQRENKLAAVTVTDGKDTAAGNRHRMNAQPDACDAPYQWRAVGRPLLEQASFTRRV